MQTFHITITGDRYPTEYTVQASSFATAIARAVRQWGKRFKGSRTQQLSVRAIKSQVQLSSNEE